MMTFSMTLAAAAALAAQPAAEVPAEPQYEVTDNVLALPDIAMTIGVPEDAVYLGATRWPLYDVVDAELHMFVRADEGGLVEEFWWIQTETYFDHVDANYTYDETEPTSLELGGKTFWTRPMFGEGRPRELREGSDSENARNMIAAGGYRMPTWLAMVRMVHMPREDRRSEVMLIHGANLDGVGMTMAEAFMAEKDGIKWTDLYGPMVERAGAAFTISAD